MKNKILFGMLALFMSVFMASCSDDDYSISKTPLLTDESVTTGSADPTATSVTLHGAVDGLDGQSASAYTVGFYYGDAAENLTDKVAGNSAATFDAVVSGKPGQVIYYQAYVTLQGRVTYKGEVKSTILTDAKALTGTAKDVTANKVVLQASLDKAPADAESGIIISGANGTEKVRAGVRKKADVNSDNYEVTVDGLLPNTTYYYTAYLDLGAGVVYGEEKSFTTPAANFNPDEDLVDLGLSTKWAKYNVGASKATDLGGLFGFGDMTGFQTSIDLEDYASEDIYKTSRDVANKVYGSWVTMPTIDEFEELFNECTKEWTEEEGVAGYKLTGPNGNSIFLPAAGSRTQGTISGIGTIGMYLSGSINATDKQFAMAYSFDQNADRRTTTPVYQALAIRPVSVAKNVKLLRENLVGKTFEIDLRLDGTYYKFHGPVYFMGKDASWASVTNNQPVVGDVDCWDAPYEGNHWAVGGGNEDDQGAKNCQGTMTFNDDGTVKVDQYQTDGTHTELTGTYTLDENKKTLTMNIQPLIPANYVGGIQATENTEIRILSLDGESMQLGVTRSDGQYLSFNYVTGDVKNGYLVTMFAAGEEGEWTQGKCTIKGGDNCLGQYTLTYTATTPHRNGQVYCLDLQGFAAKYPNALVRIDAIKADGRDVVFDANKFRYGDLENNGNYRIEMFNVWCKTGADSPFRQGGGAVSGGESALDFDQTLEVTFTVVSITSNGTGAYTPNLITINPSWGGTWGYNEGAALNVVLDDGYYKVENNQFDLTYKSGDHADGSIMTFIEIADLYGLFPGTHSTLDELYLDGKAVSYDKTKVIDSNDNPKYRLELWNCYGATKEKGCAFGTPDGDVMKGLAFKQSIRTKFTVRCVFAEPKW